MLTATGTGYSATADQRWTDVRITIGGLTFDKGELINATMIEEVDPISLTLPMGQFIFTFSNSEVTIPYNPESPDAVWADMVKGAEVGVNFMLNSSATGTGMSPLRTFYLDKVRLLDDGSTVEVVCYDCFKKLSEQYFLKGLDMNTFYTVDTATGVILDGMGFSRTVTTTALDVKTWQMPTMSVKDALRCVAQNGQCSVRWDAAAKKIVFEALAIGSPVETISGTNYITTYPKASSSDFNSVMVKQYRPQGKINTTVEVTYDAAEAGTYEIYHEPIAYKDVSVSAGTHTLVYSGFRYTKVSVTGACTITISGKEGESVEVEPYYFDITPVGDLTTVLNIDNKGVFTPANAYAIALWSYLTTGIMDKYDIQERGNPLREIGDTVLFYYKNGATVSSANGVIIRHEYQYKNGGLSAVTRVATGIS